MAMKLVSGDPFITLGRIPELESATAATCAGWVRVENQDDDVAILVRGNAYDATASWVLYRDEVAFQSGRSNTLALQLRTNASLLRLESAADAINDDRWHHFAVVFEGNHSNGLRLYVDGQLDPHSVSTVGHASVSADTSEMHLSFPSPAPALIGAMAEFGFWNAALDDASIQQLAAGFSPVGIMSHLRNLAAYYDLIRTLARPGIGPTPTESGILDTEPHPRVFSRVDAQNGIIPASSLVSGPFRSVQSALYQSGSQSGELIVAGTTQGLLLTPTGEVNS